MKRKVIFYSTESGASPIEKFIRKLDISARDKILIAIRFLQENETLPSGLFSKMVNTDDLWEIRVSHSGNIYRLLCFFDGRRLVVAANGFQKKTQKTPQQEIKTAETRKNNYFRRKDND